MDQAILITGSSGFLGSALCHALSKRYRITGFDRRPPSDDLRRLARGTLWTLGDLADEACIDSVFRLSRDRGRPIGYVIHFGAYTDFNAAWQDRYCDTNVIGTRNVIHTALQYGVQRILFAGTIAALEPAPPGSFLTERSPASDAIAYTRSKRMGEALIRDHSHRLPAVILRIGGVFTDWCELPPLFSLITLWSAPLTARLIPGKGLSGFPYIHRRDVVGAVATIIDNDHKLGECETLFAAGTGCTTHNDLFPVIRKALGKPETTLPVYLPASLAKPLLHARFAVNTLLKRKTYERAWMLDYADRPLAVDTTHTRSLIGWEPSPERHVLIRIPEMIRTFKACRSAWHARNVRRNDQQYAYVPDPA